MLGWAEISPRNGVIAGSMNTWELVYHVGKYGIDDGGSIRVARRSVSDEEDPQFENPDDSGYTVVKASRDVRLEYFFSKRGHIRPFRAALQVDVHDGSLYPGDTIKIIYGDRARNGPGLRAQTFREQEHIFKVLVDPFGTGRFKEIEESPQISIIGGPAAKLEVSAPSTTKTGESFEVIVRALDSYGNRSDEYRGKISFVNEGVHYSHIFNDDDSGAHRFEFKLEDPGLQTLKVVDDENHKAKSNPIIVKSEEGRYKLFWGDMHGQTKQTVGTGSLDEYFLFLRDVAGMDFGGWQGNDFQITDCLWEKVRDKTSAYNDPGKFILFLGYEWSGLTPAGGDYNIYFLGDEKNIHRSDHWLINDQSDEKTDRYPISELWKEYKGRGDVMAIAHVGGRHANLDFIDPEFVPLIEVHSHHGTFEWFLEEAIKRELKVGFLAASDDHTCRPGLSYPSENFTTKGGYTGVYAKELTREALWEAFWARRTYGTTGERIILDLKVDGHMMGEEYKAERPPEIEVTVHGTKPLHAVEVMNGTETVYRHPFAEPKDGDSILKIEWSGARVKSRPKRVDWSGGLYINKGRIVNFKEYSFDYLEQGIKQETNQKITWSSTTGGDADGVLLKIDAPEDAEATFYSKQTTFIFRPSEIKHEPTIIEIGPVNRFIKLQAIKDGPLPSSLGFKIVDEKINKGVNPYWVKVTQSDGSNAWSSPIYACY